jgi:putative transposase
LSDKLAMCKLNQRKVRWIVKQWDWGELSHWQIARQQGITKRHALRVYNKYKNCKRPVLCKPGRPVTALQASEITIVRELYKRQPMGATQMEKILSLDGCSIPHNRLHRILKLEGLACTQPNKSHRRKWIRYERRCSNSLWHIDWTTHENKQLCAILDDASRLIVGYGLFDNATAENAVKVLDKAVRSYGCPRQVISDHGVQFTSIARESCPEPADTVFQARLKELGIQHIKARVKHPQTNGKLERWWQTNKRLTQHFGSLHTAVRHYNEHRPHMSLENGSLRTPLQAFLEKA